MVAVMISSRPGTATRTREWDIEAYDRLLHKRDTAYTMDTLWSLLQRAGLQWLQHWQVGPPLCSPNCRLLQVWDRGILSFEASPPLARLEPRLR